MTEFRKILPEYFSRATVPFTAPYRYLTALLAGGLAVLAFAPYGYYLVMILSMALLTRCLADATARQAGWTGWWYGLGLFAPGLQWIYVSLNDFGKLPLVVSFLILGGLFAIMAGYTALACWFCNRVTPRYGFRRVLLVFPFSWVLVEWLRGHLFSGFAWLSAGYSQIDSPLSGYAPVGGVMLVGMSTVLLAGLLPMFFRSRREQLIALAVVASTGITGAALEQVSWTSPTGDVVSVSLVQPNISQDQKWRAEMFTPTLSRYDEMTRPEFGRDLIIWPEVAIPALYHDFEDSFFNPIATAAAQQGSVVMAGAILRTEDGQLFNGFTQLGSGQFYHKQKLVPFGEYFPVPDSVRNWLRLLSLPYTDFSSGEADQAPFYLGDIPLGVSICYEILFGEQIRGDVPVAQLLVNVTNDGWFGRSIGPAQHLEIARMRALETGRYLVRGTGTGITAVIKPDGEVAQQLPAFTQGVLRATVMPMAGATPFVSWGDWPLLVIAMLVLGISWRRIS